MTSRPADGATPHRLVAFFAATAALTVTFAASSAPVPVFNTYRAENGITNADLSLTVVAYFVGTIGALLFLGRVANHLGRRLSSLITLALLALGSLVLTQVTGVLPLLAGRLLMGIGAGLASSALTSYIVDSAPEKPAWLASVATSQAPMLGLTIGALTSGSFVEYGPNPRVNVYLVMIAALAVSAGLLLLAPETAGRRPGLLASLRPHVHIPDAARPLLPVAACVFVGTWAMGAYFQAFTPTIVADQLHSKNALIVALVFSAYMAPSVVGAPIGGRFRPATAQRLGMAVYLVGIIGVVASQVAAHTLAFIVSSVVAGAGQGIAVSAAIRGMLHGTSADDRAPALAAIYLMCYVGAMVPSLISGQLSHVVPTLWLTFGYGVLAVITTAITLLKARDPEGIAHGDDT